MAEGEPLTWDETYPPGAFGRPEGSLLLENLSGIVTGRMGEPALPFSALTIQNGRIAALGVTTPAADVVVDCQGAVAIPGLIDTHSHVVVGDFTPRQNSVGWLESYMHGGVTQFMSASEVHLPGRPTDRAGIKALAIVAQRSFSTFRPGGVKVLGGSLICEPVLARDDFAELGAAGVRFMKVGFGDFKHPSEAAEIVAWAHEFDFIVMCHSGGASIPGSSPIDVDTLLAIKPDIAGHANGGTTSLPDGDLLRLIDESSMALQLVQAGNLRSALHILKAACEGDALDRVILGTDTPSGTGVMPLGMLKSVCELTSLGGLTAEDGIAIATGNAARVLQTEGGVLEVRAPADVVLIQAPLGASVHSPLDSIQNGDIPGICAVIIDGQIRALRSRNTPCPMQEVLIERPYRTDRVT